MILHLTPYIGGLIAVAVIYRQLAADSAKALAALRNGDAI